MQQSARCVGQGRVRQEHAAGSLCAPLRPVRDCSTGDAPRPLYRSLQGNYHTHHAHPFLRAAWLRVWLTTVLDSQPPGVDGPALDAVAAVCRAGRAPWPRCHHGARRRGGSAQGLPRSAASRSVPSADAARGCEENVSRWARSLAHSPPAADRQRLVLILDGLDGLTDRHGAHALDWLHCVRDLPVDRVRVIVSVTDGQHASQVRLSDAKSDGQKGRDQSGPCVFRRAKGAALCRCELRRSSDGRPHRGRWWSARSTPSTAYALVHFFFDGSGRRP